MLAALCALHLTNLVLDAYAVLSKDMNLSDCLTPLYTKVSCCVYFN